MQHSSDAQPAHSQILRIPDISTMLGISRNTIYRWMQAGEFPAPIRLGKNSIGWPQDQVMKWLKNRPAHNEHTS